MNIGLNYSCSGTFKNDALIAWSKGGVTVGIPMVKKWAAIYCDQLVTLSSVINLFNTTNCHLVLCNGKYAEHNKK